jgi:hypothetical protein
MDKQNKINKLSTLESQTYFHRKTYERILNSERLIPINPSKLKCIDGMNTERLLELKVKAELAFICDTPFTDEDLLTIIKVHAPLNAKSYTSFRYSGETNNTCVVKFY